MEKPLTEEFALTRIHPLPPLRRAEVQTWLEAEGALTVNLQALLNIHPWGVQRELAAVRFWAWPFSQRPFSEQEPWKGLVALRGKSIVYPALPLGLSEEEGLQLQGQVFRRLGPQFSLMGPLKWTSQAEAFLPPSQAVQRVSYDFMVREAAKIEPEPLLADLALERAGIEKSADLFPLQEAYEKEEVFFDPEEFRPLASRWNLIKTLRNELVLVLWKEGKPLAKGGTNAQGRFWAQIGGVFTLHEHRRRGFQTLLMKGLIRELSSLGKGACLFVKKTNPAAKNLYLKLGFRILEDFEISYWNRD